MLLSEITGVPVNHPTGVVERLACVHLRTSHSSLRDEPVPRRQPAPQVVHELIERFEAHLTAGNFYSVIANMRGDSADAVASSVLSSEGLRGLQVCCQVDLKGLSAKL